MYDEEEEYEEEGGSQRKLLIVLIIVISLAVIAGAVFAVLYFTRGKGDDSDSVHIDYAAEAKVFLDEESLSAAMREAMENAQKQRIALRYQNDAYSSDGREFECRIINSERNHYDMFLIIYADQLMTDELLTTNLVPPGSGFDTITLNRALEKGDHTVYVLYNQVETGEDGHQTLCNQTAHTMDFHVQ